MENKDLMFKSVTVIGIEKVDKNILYDTILRLRRDSLNLGLNEFAMKYLNSRGIQPYNIVKEGEEVKYYLKLKPSLAREFFTEKYIQLSFDGYMYITNEGVTENIQFRKILRRESKRGTNGTLIREINKLYRLSRGRVSVVSYSRQQNQSDVPIGCYFTTHEGQAIGKKLTSNSVEVVSFSNKKRIYSLEDNLELDKVTSWREGERKNSIIPLIRRVK